MNIICTQIHDDPIKEVECAVDTNEETVDEVYERILPFWNKLRII